MTSVYKSGGEVGLGTRLTTNSYITEGSRVGNGGPAIGNALKGYPFFTYKILNAAKLYATYLFVVHSLQACSNNTRMMLNKMQCSWLTV